jgi:hypothetical protein
MSQGRELTPTTISEPLMAQSVDELKLPPRLIYVSQDYVDWNASKHYNKKHMTQHMLHRVLEQKRSVSALMTLFPVVSHVTVPDHELLTHATLSDHMIKHF